MLEGMRLMGLTKAGRTEITPGSELYFAFAGGNPAGSTSGGTVLDIWGACPYDCSVDQRQLVSSECYETLYPRGGQAAQWDDDAVCVLAQRYVAGGSGRHNPEDADDREDEDEAAARFFQGGWFGLMTR